MPERAAAALLIGAQLLLGYWFYTYLTWCYPLLVIAFIQAKDVASQAMGGVRADESFRLAD